MTDFLDGLGDVLISGAQGAAKGAAAGSIMPGFGTALGAAAGAVLGAAPQIGKWVFGADAEPTIQAVKQAVAEVTGTPDPAGQVEALKDDSVSAQLRVRLAEIAAAQEAAAYAASIELIKTQLVDTHDARDTMLGLVDKKSPLAWGAAAASFVILTGFFTMFGLLLRGYLPTDPDLKIMAIGMISTIQNATIAVVSYWVGSSAGSARKDDNARRQAAMSGRR